MAKILSPKYPLPGIGIPLSTTSKTRVRSPQLADFVIQAKLPDFQPNFLEDFVFSLT
jgi:hypothetical protein